MVKSGSNQSVISIVCDLTGQPELMYFNGIQKLTRVWTSDAYVKATLGRDRLQNYGGRLNIQTFDFVFIAALHRLEQP